ncbi:MAG TPA: GAF domain-containing protein [Planctomycetaceae bacterium]|nr:GAF domain-containing protein [Planctomycetaceae bacterium]
MLPAIPTFAEIVDAFQEALPHHRDVQAPLELLLTATAARAVGLWCVAGDSLLQLGFFAHPDMDPQTALDFATATECVGLDQLGLGIVKAAVSRAPAVATLSPSNTLGASASWLERFGARQSFAAPVLHGSQVVGVLAISTAAVHGPDAAEWNLVEQLAERLGPMLAS